MDDVKVLVYHSLRCTVRLYCFFLQVLLKTSAGDIDIELWSKEAPKACRNFVQLCMEGYYDSTIFHRVVPEFIVQGGDPTGTGTGGESIYGRPFKDEFHSRLRFNRRGLVAMANAGPHDNGSQFFFTLGRADELNNKHTIFGKVTGDTVFNMLRLAEVETDKDERPLNAHKVRSTEVLHSPFDDIVPRAITNIKKEKEKEDGKKFQSKATKNFSLLSFGEEAEEEEVEVNKVSQKCQCRIQGVPHSSLSEMDKKTMANALQVLPVEVTMSTEESGEEDNPFNQGEQMAVKVKMFPFKSKTTTNIEYGIFPALEVGITELSISELPKAPSCDDALGPTNLVYKTTTHQKISLYFLLKTVRYYRIPVRAESPAEPDRCGVSVHVRSVYSLSFSSFL
ncbi:UNVERIFIED_CONTAM: hypothetical protein FKN15_074266 [Acipenser sinensis]